jgi:ABC-2 type transport system permease protein
MLLIGLVTVNVADEGGELLLYSPAMAIGAIGFSLLAALLAGAGGVLVSLRASTARQAQQTVSMAVMVLLFVPVFGIQFLPEEWRASLMSAFASLDVTLLLFVVAGVMLALDGVLLTAASARFQRARLILD